MNYEEKVTFKDAIERAFTEEFARNHDIVLMGEDVLDMNRGTTLAELKKKFPNRIINHLPLIEDMLGGIGLGMSIGGLKPVIQLDYETFVTLAFDSLYRIGTWRYRMGESDGPGVVFRIGHAGYNTRGAEFSASLLASIFHLPNILIATPSRPYYAIGLIKTALRMNKPIVFIEHKMLYEKRGQVPKEEYTLPFGLSSVFKPGKDVTIVSWLFLSYLALEAAKRLTSEGIDSEVVSLHTLNPLDLGAILASAKKTKRVLVVEEDMLRGGIGAEISAQITERLSQCFVKRLAAKNTAIPALGRHEKLILPTIDSIVNECRLLYKNSK